MNKLTTFLCLTLASCLSLPIFIFLITTIADAQQGWSLQTNPLGPQGPPTPSLGTVEFVSPTEGWITVSNGNLLHTTNGGTVWTVETPGGSDTVGFQNNPGRGLSFIDPSTGWAIGTLGGFNSARGAVLYKTTNGGGTWSRQVLASWTYGFGVQFVDANNGWAMVFNGPFPTNISSAIIHTTDGGNTWSTQYPANGKIAVVFFIDPNNGLGITDSLSSSPKLICPCEILHTTNAGTTWITQLHDNTPGTFEDFHSVDINNAWVVGDSAKILRTTNGGTSWTSLTNAGITSSSKNRAVFFLNDNEGWIGNGAGGPSGNHVLHTTDGGTTWTSNPSQTQYEIFSIFFIDANNGWLSADYGGIAQTGSGGEPIRQNPLLGIWNKVDGPSSVLKYNILNDSTATILQSDSSSLTYNYVIDTSVTPHRVRSYSGGRTVNLSIWSISGNILTIQGSSGDTTTYPPSFTNPSHYTQQITDVEDNHSKASKVFSLLQNYPNPFNPTTMIRFGLPQTERVVLSVFNVLGQQVAELVNEKQEIGYHEVAFDGAALPSGIYFYRLQAGDPSTSSGRSFVETKKLLLMK